jgi:hypothetical protein
MYNVALPDTTINTEHVIKSIEGPCDNSTYESLAPTINSIATFIPHVKDEQLVIEERYSTINGSFGTVR